MASATTTHVDPAAKASDAFVPVQTRSERPTSFDPADFGMPTGREVNWKYTPIAKIDAALKAEEYHEDALEYELANHDDAQISSLTAEAAPRGSFFVPEDIAAAKAWQNSREALHVKVPANAELEKPITVEITGKGVDQPGAAHIVIEAEPNSHGTVVLHHTGSASYLQNVEIIVRDGADLTVVTVQRWSDDSVHLASHQARVDKDAKLTHFVVSLGGGVVRVNPSLELNGTGSEGNMFGLYFADAGQHLESQVYLHHKGQKTVGDVLYKGALQGEGAHTVWVGDVLIGPDAEGTDSYEANRNLMLTENTRADSVPNLEIETGAIEGAGHASATGRFDDEQLFYLQARGIPEEEARRLVVFGFLGEIVQRLELPELEAELNAAIEAELAGVA